MQTEGKVKGIYIAEKKYDLVWLTDAKTKSAESLNYFKFAGLLTQAFTEKQRNIILEEINCFRKVILDFDKQIAKKVIDKEPNYLDSMKSFFSSKYIQNQLDDPFADSIDIYKAEESIKGGFNI